MAENDSKNGVEGEEHTPEVNIDEIISKIQDAPTEVICDVVKTLDANRYATKKTVAQGMLDIALLTSNASQLKYVLQVGPKHEFYTLLVTLISISIVLQVAMGFVLLTLNLLHDCRFHKPRHRTASLRVNYLTTAAAFIVTVLNVLVSAFDSSLLLVGLLFVVIGGMDLNDDDDRPSAVVLNDVIVIFIFVISVINIIISGFGIEYSNNPLVLERYYYFRMGNNTAASAGILALLVSFIDTEGEAQKNQKQKRLANWLYHTSVGLMTGAITCDVIKMTFGLDPALSENDYRSNYSSNFYQHFFNSKK